MVTRRDYTAEAVEAAKSVLIELTRLLGEYRDNIVLIGGWVPELLIPQEPRPHVGSMDIDLALNHLKIHEEALCAVAITHLIPPFSKGGHRGITPYP